LPFEQCAHPSRQIPTLRGSAKRESRHDGNDCHMTTNYAAQLLHRAEGGERLAKIFPATKKTVLHGKPWRNHGRSIGSRTHITLLLLTSGGRWRRSAGANLRLFVDGQRLKASCPEARNREAKKRKIGGARFYRGRPPGRKRTLCHLKQHFSIARESRLRFQAGSRRGRTQ